VTYKYCSYSILPCPEFIDKRGKVIKAAEEFGIQCISESFLTDVKVAGAKALHLIQTKAISDWGDDLEERVKRSKAYSSAMKSMGSVSKERSESSLVFNCIFLFIIL